ncbi:type II toxin-antitoxin system RelE family toxin [Acetobacterium sp. UBA5834]|uniref:type II toxin-antitoxin system RelE family toxin n=1 Tax=Acetobacterium sp. UBA5834 TaxID=1945907 RepID=UPI00257EFB78|nr:type II toxin-antitoxin system RelE/ParE family toxin [Acetobacterium sp. UBA5834]
MSVGSGYKVVFTKSARKDLKKIENVQLRFIKSWLVKNLEGCENPRLYGKALVGDKKDFWRYRVGAYRLIANIDDGLIIIEIVSVGHRREVYK